MMVFCNFLAIKAETKKVVGINVVSFEFLYNCVKFRRLKMGDPVYTLKEMDSQIHTSSPKLVNQIYLYVVTKF